jgi:methylthioribose-1-phosphate isomerase
LPGEEPIPIVTNTPLEPVPFILKLTLSAFAFLSLNRLSSINENEITEFKKNLIAPNGSRAINPSFDVTNYNLITGIICEKGFIDPLIKGDLMRVIDL